ncbi:MAG TPA: hypothetical protein VFA51_09170 [Candidatus Udaeobacter sp.]|nr:hypothetical protein [Candidatus Udaeobacter sp.]
MSTRIDPARLSQENESNYRDACQQIGTKLVAQKLFQQLIGKRNTANASVTKSGTCVVNAFVRNAKSQKQVEYDGGECEQRDRRRFSAQNLRCPLPDLRGGG